jgi:hypothetical protein
LVHLRWSRSQHWRCPTWVPVPAALTAEIRNVYVVECDRPVTVVDVVVEVPSVNVVHVVPLSDE